MNRLQSLFSSRFFVLSLVVLPHFAFGAIGDADETSGAKFCAQVSQSAAWNGRIHPKPRPVRAPLTGNDILQQYRNLTNFKYISLENAAGQPRRLLLGSFASLKMPSSQVDWADGKWLAIDGQLVEAPGLNQWPMVIKTAGQIKKFLQYGQFIIAIDNSLELKVFHESGFLARSYKLPAQAEGGGPTSLAFVGRNGLAIGTANGRVLLVSNPINFNLVRHTGTGVAVNFAVNVANEAEIADELSCYKDFSVGRFAVVSIQELGSTMTQRGTRLLVASGYTVTTALHIHNNQWQQTQETFSGNGVLKAAYLDTDYGRAMITVHANLRVVLRVGGVPATLVTDEDGNFVDARNMTGDFQLIRP